MQFRILGPVSVEVDGRVRPIPGVGQRTLLAALLIGAGRLVPTDQLYAEIWGDDLPATVENALQAHVSRLRRTLRKLAGPGGEAPALITRSSGYVLDVAPQDVDLVLFQEDLAHARAVMATDPSLAGDLLTAALSHWRGAPLQDVSPGPLCRSTALQLEEESLAAREDLLWLGAHHQQPTAVIGELRRMSAAHPWRERLTGTLMVALYRSGRQAEAVQVYRAARKRLVDELGMEPSPELTRVFHGVLNQDLARTA